MSGLVRDVATLTRERERVAVAIMRISATLKESGIPEVERRMLNQDRKDLRGRLAEIDAMLGKGAGAA